MKKILFLLLVVMVICSCETNTNSHELKDAYGGQHFTVVEVDSCEYIINGNWFAHKGNCKFCTQRLKNK